MNSSTGATSPATLNVLVYLIICYEVYYWWSVLAISEENKVMNIFIRMSDSLNMFYPVSFTRIVCATPNFIIFQSLRDYFFSAAIFFVPSSYCSCADEKDFQKF